jgi:hypothetical protein
MSCRVTKAVGLSSWTMLTASMRRRRGMMVKARRTSPSRPSALITVTPNPAARRSLATCGLSIGDTTRIIVFPTARLDSSRVPR